MRKQNKKSTASIVAQISMIYITGMLLLMMLFLPTGEYKKDGNTNEVTLTNQPEEETSEESINLVVEDDNRESNIEVLDIQKVGLEHMELEIANNEDNEKALYAKRVNSLFEDIYYEDDFDYYHMYTAEKTAIYDYPDDSKEPTSYLKINTEIKIVGEVFDWIAIELDGEHMYIHNPVLSDSKNYTDDELFLLSHIIANEAGACDDLEQQYVGSVVLNRVASYRFPNTIREVLFQPGQYPATDANGNFRREPTQQNIDNAIYLLENGSILPSNVVFQAQFRQGDGVYIKTKWHYYCYKN